jgi:DNA replication protein DnaC
LRLHRCRKKSSTIFCSQYRIEGWYEQLGGSASPMADAIAILDRVVHDGYKINIESIDPAKVISMREVFGLDKHLSE